MVDPVASVREDDKTNCSHVKLKKNYRYKSIVHTYITHTSSTDFILLLERLTSL